MSTAQEMAMRILVADKRMDGIRRAVEIQMRDVCVYGMHLSQGREVSARRARKLAKRGEGVLRIGTSKTGKTRYSWMRRVPPLSIYKVPK